MVSIYRFIIFFILSAILIFYSNTLTNRFYSKSEIEKISNQTEEFNFKSMGYKSEKGNLVLISNSFRPIDFASEEIYFNKIESILKTISEKNFIGEETFIIFPEHIGSFLFLIDEKKEIYNFKTLNEALEKIKYSNPELVLTKNLIPKLIEKKKNKILEIYKNTFLKLSKKYSVSIFAGSIVLPELKFENENLVFSSTELKNQSLIFTSEEKIYEKIGSAKNISELDKSIFELKENPNSEILNFFDTSILLTEDSRKIELEKIKTGHIVSINFTNTENSEFYDKIKNLSSNKSYAQIFFKGKFFNLEMYSNEIQSIRYINLENHNDKKSFILNHFLN